MFARLISLFFLLAVPGFCVGAMNGEGLPLCRNNSHVSGQWVRHNIAKPPFTCCPTGAADQALLHKDKEEDGGASFAQQCTLSREAIVYSERGVRGANMPVGRGCTCDTVNSNNDDKNNNSKSNKPQQLLNNLRLNVSTNAHGDYNKNKTSHSHPNTSSSSSVPARMQYLWQPSSCRLARWNTDDLCRRLGPRKVLMMGDSTMEQCSSTLMSLLGLANAPCVEQFLYARSSYLYFGRFGKEFRLDENVIKYKPDIVVLTVGAWLEDQGDMQHVLGQLKPQLARIQTALGYTPKFVFKTQNPGHVDCHKFTEPITWEYERTHNLSTQRTNYHWHEHPQFDEQVRAFAQREGWALMDMSPLYLRPDAHPKHNKDCLHYCLPGPVDLFAALFHQMLIVGEL